MPAVETIDERRLARPASEADYQRGLVSDHQEVSAGYHVMRRGGSLTSYLTYTVSGRGFFRDARDRAIRVNEGDLVLLEPRVYQEYGLWPQSSSWATHWVHFDAQPHWHPWLPLSVRPGPSGLSLVRLEARALRRRVVDLFCALQMQRARPSPGSYALCLNLIERILILAQGQGDAPTPLDPRIRRVLQAIGNGERVAPTAAELGALVGLSPSRLAYLFRKHTGDSILGAVNRARLRAAQHALHEPGTSLDQVAERAGFQSAYSFSNWYLQQTGLRPGAYRRKWRSPVASRC